MSTIRVTNLQNASAASPAIVLDANSRATLNGLSYPTEGSLSGRNRIINGDMRIDQRNAGASVSSGTSTNTYTLDRWYAFATGAAITAQRVAGSGSHQYACRLTGASSNTLVQFVQRIESFNSYSLAGGTATFSCVLKASTNTSVTVYFAYPTATDNYTSTTAISDVTFNATTAATTFSAQVSIPAAATTGLQVLFAFNSGLGSGVTFDITGVQLEAGSVATPYERRPYSVELGLCQRYYEKRTYASADPVGVGGANTNNTAMCWAMLNFIAEKRAAPTCTLVTAASTLQYMWRGNAISASTFDGFANSTVVGTMLTYTLGSASATVGGWTRANGTLTIDASAEL